MKELTKNDRFDGDFDVLPLRAHVLYGEVPAYPTANDFVLACITAAHEQDPAAEWRVEAIRWRRRNLGQPLDPYLRVIAQNTAARLRKLALKGI